MSSRSIVFMGTPEFACPTLQALIDRGERLLAVVTQPDRPKGRGHKLMPPPVKELALAHDIPVLQPHRVRASAFVESIRQLAPELIVVVAFGQILPKALLDIPPLGCVNVHASLLPRYRGAAPLNWCIINGETETGVTTMLMDTGLDTGPMLLKRSTPIDENEDIVSLHDRMASLGAELLAETLDGLREGRIEPQPQNDSLSCYAPLLKKEHGLIDWQRPARQIHNQVRGLAAWPGAQTLLNGHALKLFRTRVADGAGAPGTVLCSTGGQLEVACLDGSLLIQELQLAGKKRLDSASFLAGCPIAEGTLLGGAATERPIP
ncbi:methionyl-tRNA formyltransferase [Pelobacter propionicus]|uniref:Methionyl-tRNA formyltransferase n=1 Tax=Pelobacter propionicus (strain DSM 2379 / NBRC 103807 / OttBd1) TaxID=338966 RepID=FMT_PELPD|nr:methionyl-tRNA formyltransferase [Pelobacter propionicus]A1ALC4.1 RecName: Full=Methionyl-tRNA formyltransferase [Pelobacter propionicus DSM 2379]ABK98144.1 methionyl-tRNA formyltransferase [Pelobacter propionicus DSM 2379]